MWNPLVQHEKRHLNCQLLIFKSYLLCSSSLRRCSSRILSSSIRFSSNNFFNNSRAARPRSYCGTTEHIVDSIWQLLAKLLCIYWSVNTHNACKYQQFYVGVKIPAIKSLRFLANNKVFPEVLKTVVIYHITISVFPEQHDKNLGLGCRLYKIATFRNTGILICKNKLVKNGQVI